MSSKWFWLGFIPVAAVLALSVWWDRAYNGGEQVGSILILGATALVVVCYADAAYRTAESTQKLAESSVRPVLQLEFAHLRDRHLNCIWNSGNGPASSVAADVGDAEIELPDVLPAGVRAFSKNLDNAQACEQRVRLSYKDSQQTEYDSWWEYVPEDEQWYLVAQDGTEHEGHPRD